MNNCRSLSYSLQLGSFRLAPINYVVLVLHTRKLIIVHILVSTSEPAPGTTSPPPSMGLLYHLILPCIPLPLLIHLTTTHQIPCAGPTLDSVTTSAHCPYAPHSLSLRAQLLVTNISPWVECFSIMAAVICHTWSMCLLPFCYAFPHLLL